MLTIRKWVKHCYGLAAAWPTCRWHRRWDLGVGARLSTPGEGGPPGGPGSHLGCVPQPLRTQEGTAASRRPQMPTG